MFETSMGQSELHSKDFMNERERNRRKEKEEKERKRKLQIYLYMKANMSVIMYINV